MGLHNHTLQTGIKQQKLITKTVLPNCFQIAEIKELQLNIFMLLFSYSL